MRILSGNAAKSPLAVHEDAVARFFASAYRKRWRTLIADPRKRGKVLDGLNHFRHLDPRFALKVPRRDQTPGGILALLAARGAPACAHVISANSELDGCEMRLDDALGAVVGAGNGTIVSCLPGRVAYFEGEDPGERYVLERRS